MIALLTNQDLEFFKIVNALGARELDFYLENLFS
jgi:hypothetical protein